MNSWNARTGRALVLSLDPGDDVLKSLVDACAAAGLRHGFVASGVGTLDRCRLHCVTTTQYPPVEHFPEWIDTPLELTGMSGVIVDGKPHIHATVADESQAWGGHLEPGCRVLYLAEVVLVELGQVELQRAADAQGVVRLLPAPAPEATSATH